MLLFLYTVVLIVAECNVNVVIRKWQNEELKVLIVAECNVNVLVFSVMKTESHCFNSSRV